MITCIHPATGCDVTVTKTEVVEEAPGTSATIIAVAVAVPVCVVIAAVVAFVIYRYKKSQAKKKMMENMYVFTLILCYSYSSDKILYIKYYSKTTQNWTRNTTLIRERLTNLNTIHLLIDDELPISILQDGRQSI